MLKNSKASAPVLPLNFPPVPVVIGTCLFIAAVLAGLLGLSSCSTSPEGVAREDAVIVAISNSVANARAIAPYVPAPGNSLIEPLLAMVSAGLAIWSGYLHRSVRVLVKQNGNASTTPPRAGP